MYDLYFCFTLWQVIWIGGSLETIITETIKVKESQSTEKNKCGETACLVNIFSNNNINENKLQLILCMEKHTSL